MTETLPSYLSALNPEQREAVLHNGAALLILAGAGSGKTRVITTKIAYLIRERGIPPYAILAVTFTNKAAREMAGRAAAIDSRAGYAMLRTFHSFGAWFLRRNARLVGLNPAFTIYDDDDMASLLATVSPEKTRAEIKLMAHQISRAKDYFISPSDPELKRINHRKDFQKMYARYEKRLAEIGNVDFGDLIKKPVDILRSNPSFAEDFRSRFKVIMIDEYQDTNVAQFTLLKELCGPETYVCVVGDDDQSIYRFRGAEVRNIIEFPDRFPNTDIIRLERNYRSTSAILRVASSVVDNNKGRLGKTLSAERGTGKIPVLAFLPNQDEEAVFAAHLIESSVHPSAGNQPHSGNTAKAKNENKEKREGRYSDWAILYRTNAQSLGFETELLRRHIPYRVVGSLKFYEREEIKDALALLSFLVNPRDEISFRRVVNKPARGVGEATMGRVIADAADGDLWASAKRLSAILPARARAGLSAFIDALESGRSALTYPAGEDVWDARARSGDALFDMNEPRPSEAGDRAGRQTPAKEAKKTKMAVKKIKTGEKGEVVAGEGLSRCVATLIQNTGVAAYHLTHDEIAGNQRIANLQELANAASLYPATLEGLLEFLEHIELDRSMEERDTDANVVTLITLHNTKGLEFKRVIITGVEQGVFPRDDKKEEELEEERRLFYVGVTRAMDELYFTSCAARRMFGQTAFMEPSLFLGEIDKSALRIIGVAPRGFSMKAKAGERKAKGAKSDRVEWDVGDRVFNDDHGYGYVKEIRDHATGAILIIRFDTGKELSFLSDYNRSNLTRIDEEQEYF
ncbi:MAG: ATP-dependent helicase [Treponema sp.]|jgi:DNA helicase-2/ATP-dependent DNA helicase PcrA|nr:ATP-dependent helicase [Treponema sp.]